ncbi:MAG: hypothetical protein P1R58_13510 [bacterium]|nr:hypothetical protein [bacterium]
MSGKKLATDVPVPLRFELDPTRPGKMKAMYKTGKLLLASSLVRAILDAGVDNLEVFNAIVFDPSSNTEYADYNAVNIIGAVACADLDKSDLMTHDVDMISMSFNSLVIDESKIEGLLIFRLAEAVNAIIVHEKVRDSIIKHNIPNMYFYGPGEWSG